MKRLLICVDYDEKKTTKEEDAYFVEAIKNLHGAVDKFGHIDIYELTESSGTMYNRIRTELQRSRIA